MKKENTGWKMLIFFLGAFMMAIFFLLFLLKFNNYRLFGVEYTLNDDGESYTLSNYGWYNKDETFIVPSSYNGKPVTEIGDNALTKCFTLKSVVISDNVKKIGLNAFSDCPRLTSVYITSLEPLYTLLFLEPNAYLVNILYLNGNLVTDLVIPDSVTSINDYVLSNCDNLTSVIIPDSVISIGMSAFSNCDKLTSVIIPDSVTNIEDFAFDDCDKLTIYYEAGEVEWNNIDLGDRLEIPPRYYYSETQPTEDGNFWHYDANGEIAIWNQG